MNSIRRRQADDIVYKSTQKSVFRPYTAVVLGEPSADVSAFCMRG
jgi:hypothetical protein